jgi:hypothetical protein
VLSAASPILLTKVSGIPPWIYTARTKASTSRIGRTGFGDILDDVANRRLTGNGAPVHYPDQPALQDTWSWGSSLGSGTEANLNVCGIYERLDYPTGWLTPFVGGSTGFNAFLVSGSATTLVDPHASAMPFTVFPSVTVTVLGQQQYYYQCSCDASNTDPVPLGDLHTITRLWESTPGSLENYKYTISKDSMSTPAWCWIIDLSGTYPGSCHVY